VEIQNTYRRSKIRRKRDQTRAKFAYGLQVRGDFPY
jgi:hypothetical protein